MHFWNNLHRVHSKSRLESQIIFKSCRESKPKGLNGIAIIGYGCLCLEQAMFLSIGYGCLCLEQAMFLSIGYGCLCLQQAMFLSIGYGCLCLEQAMFLSIGYGCLCLELGNVSFNRLWLSLPWAGNVSFSQFIQVMQVRHILRKDHIQIFSETVEPNLARMVFGWSPFLCLTVPSTIQDGSLT